MARIAQVCAVILVAAAIGTAAAGLPGQDQNSTANGRLARPFESGGRMYMNLSAGAYRIEGTRDNEIRVRWRTRNPEDMSSVRAKMDVKGRDATLRLDGPGNNFSANVELPERTDVTIHLSAGDLDVRRLEGSKDIDMWAGDLTVEVGDTSKYRHVSASVRSGEISASPFKVNKGGLFRSFQADGAGSYDLRVKLMAGDLKLVR